MREQLLRIKDKTLEAWSKLSKAQKWMIIGIGLFLIVSFILLFNWASQPKYTTIYTNLSPSETGEIVSEIEAKGIPVQISADGKSISVPEIEAPKLKVELAHAGIPRSGNINYSVFSENMSFGTTDRQFDVVERDAMQNELRYLIEQIDGIDRADVMITLPRESVWLMDAEQTASASVVINTRQGLELNATQIQGLYHLISKSVPDLPVENIVIMDQNWRAYELTDSENLDTTLSQHQQQREVIKDIERDIQRELHHLLGTIMGMDKVIVSVFANVDFAIQRSEEHIVQPVDPETNEGIAISIERIQETFSGEGGSIGGIPGTGDGDIAGYQGADGAGNSDYEKLEERINREVNRIYRTIDSSPYAIKDLTINVGVEPPIPADPNSLTEQNVTDIKSILRSVISTYLSTSSIVVTQEELDQKITVFAREFSGRPVIESTVSGISDLWLYALVGVAVLALSGVAFTLIRRNKRKAGQAEAEETGSVQPVLEDYNFDQESEEAARRKRIERLAKSNPDEFVKLLRTWLADD